MHGGNLHPLITPPPEGTARSSHQSLRQALVIVVLCDFLVLTIYVWMASVGTWTQWPTHWQLYDQLATSFRHGQLALEQKPDPALLALPDPYDPAARQGIASPQDLSLYKGRFYLYWGPVPALLLVPIKSLIPGTIGDQYLGFAFIAGIFLLQSYLIATIRRLFFPAAPAWTLAPLILAAGLMNPWPWLISTPSIYVAAITGGQFFFLAGLAIALASLGQPRVTGWALAAAGILWDAAVGCRITLVVPVAFMTGCLAIATALTYRRAGRLPAAIPALLALAVALSVGLIGLGWYNWARFGSVFETGIRYQLAGIPLQDYGGTIVAPGYLTQNLYNYFLNPPRLRVVFPYFSPMRGSTQSVIPSFTLPAAYKAQEVVGLLFTAGFILFALLPLAGGLWRRNSRGAETAARRLTGWVIALAGVFLSSSAFFLLFFWIAERYLADFLPGLFLLSVIGSWQADQYCAGRPVGRVLYWILFVLLIAASLIISLILSISFNSDGFRQLNPILWRQLSNLFRP